MRKSVSLATTVATSYLGRPYLWGGDDPLAGFDCSGYCIEILKSVGILPRDGDWTAQGLYSYFKKFECVVDYQDEGCLVFYGKSTDKIYHVEYCVTPTISIGASGGNDSTLTEQDAINQNAYIKMRPIRRPIAVVDPFRK